MAVIAEMSASIVSLCFLATSVEVQQRLWPTEEFELAKTRVSTSLPENDLFAGIEEEEEA